MHMKKNSEKEGMCSEPQHRQETYRQSLQQLPTS